MSDDRNFDYPQELYKHNLLLWQPVFVTTSKHGRQLHNVNGPYCTSCRASVKSQDENHSLDAKCQNFGKDFTLTIPLVPAKQQAYVAFEAKLREYFQVISLELPPDVILDKDENDKYWIEARLGQKNGKLMGVIYMGEKLPEQTRRDYVQMFTDIEDQQIRFDKGNKNPLKLLSKIEAEFEESTNVVEKK
jgi:hypothetical protein